ncbi:MAG: 6-carboxytetrahydropterin synthase QueD [Treponema sp.]|nr:6-carboxytetrahydropterin synthase QueD [Treponema sp.]
MFEVRVEAAFSAAHFLQDYHGKCERLHGHNYKVFAHARGSTLDEGGMLLDFSELKKALRTVCEELDHRNLNDFDFFRQNPSAERIAMYIYEGIVRQIPSLRRNTDRPDGGASRETGSASAGSKTSSGAATLYAVDVFETDTSRARFCPD